MDFSAARNYSFNQACIRDGLVNKALIVGANGCGKTNLGFALFDIVGTLTDRGLDALQMDSLCFLNGDSEAPYATFVYHLKFDAGDVRYEYRKTDPENIVFERMEMNGDVVFERDGLGGTSDYSNLEGSNAGNLRMDIGNGRLSVARYIANNTVQSPDSPIGSVVDFASHMLYFRSVPGISYIGVTKGSEFMEGYIIDNGLVEDFQKFLLEMADIDMDLEGVKIDGMQDIFVQRTRSKSLPFNRVASSGTRSLLLFYYWMKHFRDVRFLYMDDFDAYYHYELSERVLRLVSDMGDFQAVLTSHNTSLVSNGILRPDCYFLMEGNRVRAFSDLTERELREGHNLEKLYRGGEFNE